MATFKASANRTLRDAYQNLLDDLDDDKELTFALMQQVYARQFRRVPDRERRPDTPRSDRIPDWDNTTLAQLQNQRRIKCRHENCFLVSEPLVAKKNSPGGILLPDS
jgi:hypothetical protein